MTGLEGPPPLFADGRGGAGPGGVPLGTWLKLPAVESAEIVAHAGFDFVVVDLEHAPLAMETAYRLISTSAALGVTPLVRVPDHTPSTIQKVLDAGAHGVLVPHVDTPEQARLVARATRFPPRGDRGAGGTSRAGRWGTLPTAGYLDRGNRALCIPQLESRDAVLAAEHILALDDVDAIFVGTADLGLSLGLPPTDPAVAELVQHALDRAGAAGKPCGLAFGDAPEQAARAADAGCGFVMLSNDTSLLAAAAVSVVSRCATVSATLD